MPETKLLIPFTAQTDGEYCNDNCEALSWRYCSKLNQVLFREMELDNRLSTWHLRCSACLTAEQLAKETDNAT